MRLEKYSDRGRWLVGQVGNLRRVGNPPAATGRPAPVDNRRAGCHSAPQIPLSVTLFCEHHYHMRIRTILMAIYAACALAQGAEWPTDGGNPKRTNWQQDEKILNKD